MAEHKTFMFLVHMDPETEQYSMVQDLEGFKKSARELQNTLQNLRPHERSSYAAKLADTNVISPDWLMTPVNNSFPVSRGRGDKSLQITLKNVFLVVYGIMYKSTTGVFPMFAYNKEQHLFAAKVMDLRHSDKETLKQTGLVMTEDPKICVARGFHPLCVSLRIDFSN